MRIKFSLPLYALFPAGAAVLMLWFFLVISSWLGFTHCWAWTRLPAPPGRAVRFVDVLADRVFVQTENEDVYCYEKSHWRDCVRSPFASELRYAPDWLRTNYVSIPAVGAVTQLVQADHFIDSAYYALSASGDVLSCSLPLETRIENMFRSGGIILLIVPLGLGLWGSAVFLDIFVKEANPMYWDFFGRGTRIK